jgi:hypothetical protein
MGADLTPDERIRLELEKANAGTEPDWKSSGTAFRATSARDSDMGSENPTWSQAGFATVLQRLIRSMPAEGVGKSNPYADPIHGQVKAKDPLAGVRRLQEKLLAGVASQGDADYQAALTESMSPTALAANLAELGGEAVELMSDHWFATLTMAAIRAAMQYGANRAAQKGSLGPQAALAAADMALLLGPLGPHIVKWRQAVQLAATTKDTVQAANAMKDAQRNYALVVASAGATLARWGLMRRSAQSRVNPERPPIIINPGTAQAEVPAVVGAAVPANRVAPWMLRVPQILKELGRFLSPSVPALSLAADAIGADATSTLGFGLFFSDSQQPDSVGNRPAVQPPASGQSGAASTLPEASGVGLTFASLPAALTGDMTRRVEALAALERPAFLKELEKGNYPYLLTDLVDNSYILQQAIDEAAQRIKDHPTPQSIEEWKRDIAPLVEIQRRLVKEWDQARYNMDHKVSPIYDGTRAELERFAWSYDLLQTVRHNPGQFAINFSEKNEQLQRNRDCGPRPSIFRTYEAPPAPAAVSAPLGDLLLNPGRIDEELKEVGDREMREMLTVLKERLLDPTAAGQAFRRGVAHYVDVGLRHPMLGMTIQHFTGGRRFTIVKVANDEVTLRAVGTNTEQVVKTDVLAADYFRAPPVTAARPQDLPSGWDTHLSSTAEEAIREISLRFGNNPDVRELRPAAIRVGIKTKQGQDAEIQFDVRIVEIEQKHAYFLGLGGKAISASISGEKTAPEMLMLERFRYEAREWSNIKWNIMEYIQNLYKPTLPQHLRRVFEEAAVEKPGWRVELYYPYSRSGNENPVRTMPVRIFQNRDGNFVYCATDRDGYLELSYPPTPELIQDKAKLEELFTAFARQLFPANTENMGMDMTILGSEPAPPYINRIGPNNGTPAPHSRDH